MFRLRHDIVRCEEAGSLHDVYVLESNPWVNVVPQTANGEVLIIRQFRHGLGEPTWEVPGGLVDAGEEPAAAARRELREETGYGTGRLRPLGVLGANPAIQSNRVHIFVAEDCRPAGDQQLDPMEDIEVKAVPVEALMPMIEDGTMVHSLAVASVLLYLARRQSERQ